MSSSNGSNGGNDLDSVPASKRSLRRASTTKLSTTSNSATKEKPLQTTSQLVGAMPPASPLQNPTRASSPFGYLSASSSACTPVADFDSNDEDFGTPFEHELEDGQASVTQGDDGLDATGDSFLDSINASSVPAYHGPKSCDTDVRISVRSHPLVSWTSNPLRIIITLFQSWQHPIHSPHPDSPDTPILDITDGTHDDFLLSDGDSDNAVPLKVRGNAKPILRQLCPPNLSPTCQKSQVRMKMMRISKEGRLPPGVHPAYDELIKKYGGEKSEDWAAESARLVKEYTETRAAISADITKHGGEVAKIIASHKRAWQKDFRALASFGVHCELTVLADNACSPAAHAQNGQLFGTAEMESYYKSRHDFKSHVGDIYTFILSAKAGVRKAEEHKAQTLRHEREEAFKNPNKAKGKVSKMLIQLFEPFICWTTFPWLKLPQKLLSHNLVIDGVLPLSCFRLFGSLSIDHYSVSEIQAMYNALENGQLKVSECTHEESNSGETALITDSGGQVLMTVASALEMIGAKKKLDSKRAAERAVVRAQAVDTMIDGGDSGGDSDGHHGNGHPVRNPSHTVMVNSDRIVTQGLGKRPRKGGDDFNQLRKTKRLQVKSAEIIDDLDETPTAGPSHLHVQATSSHRNDVQQHSAFSSDSEATVGIPLQHTTGVPIVPTFNPHDPFSMMDDVPIPNRDMSFPLLDPSLFQGPEFEALVAQYQKYTDNAHPEIWEHAAAQDPNPRPSASYTMTDQIRCHTPTEAGVWQYYVLSPCAKPHPKPAQTKAKAKYGCTQAPESPAPNTHGDHHDELNMIPYAAAVGVWSFLPPRNFTHPRIHRQGPGRNMGAHTATQDNPQASLHDDESNTVPHAHFGRLSPSVKPPCDECTNKARANYGRPHSHARFQRLTIHNQYNDESNTVPHTRQSRYLLPL
ncbi:hypothetical protein BS47DRAFT_1360647 [Hydnum rufescens UP504]|uniref:Uncharacterized protein n=1 Tax=Hydnum rufescens UP504 TaxID=1448309 RepID=A0A9P6B1U3_9AGAM|nr:hypothetical protein BS47DRAFT_1360647 [Hydnum rufescens UP504]